jgi:hypothetical protein
MYENKELYEVASFRRACVGHLVACDRENHAFIFLTRDDNGVFEPLSSYQHSYEEAVADAARSYCDLWKIAHTV